MNIRRGLFRLWVFASAIWLVSLGAYLWFSRVDTPAGYIKATDAVIAAMTSRWGSQRSPVRIVLYLAPRPTLSRLGTGSLRASWPSIPNSDGGMSGGDRPGRSQRISPLRITSVLPLRGSACRWSSLVSGAECAGCLRGCAADRSARGRAPNASPLSSPSFAG
jgi:hypothetical protein